MRLGLTLAAGGLWLGLALAARGLGGEPSTGAAPTESAPAEGVAAGEAATAPAKAELTPELSALRDRCRAAVRAAAQPLSLRDCTPAQLMDASAAFGCTLLVRDGGSPGKSVSAVGALMWNLNCGGYRLMVEDAGRPLPRTGYGLQQYPSQLLAAMALARLALDYEIRAGAYRGTVADLVAAEQRDCQSASNSPQRLIGLSHYVRDQRSWDSADGQTWSIGRMVDEELARRVDPGDVQSVHHLLALSFAVARASDGQPVEDSFRRAKDYVSKYQDYAFDVQNPDGSWHESFFAMKGPSRSELGSLRSTGHILHWLALSLPEERLQDPRLVRAVGYTANLVSKHAPRAMSLAPRDFESLMHAAGALAMYDARVFAPREP